MALNKFDQKSDGIVDLYRSALYLARGAAETGQEFLKKAKGKLDKESGVLLPEIPINKLKNCQQQLFWAEKILDQYLKLKHS